MLLLILHHIIDEMGKSKNKPGFSQGSTLASKTLLENLAQKNSN